MNIDFAPFQRLVDVVTLPNSKDGNYYIVIFVGHLTKWEEVFPVKVQRVIATATLLVHQILGIHGVPAEILSDRRKAFMSESFKEVERLLSFHKVNTMAYHPQTYG